MTSTINLFAIVPVKKHLHKLEVLTGRTVGVSTSDDRGVPLLPLGLSDAAGERIGGFGERSGS